MNRDRSIVPTNLLDWPRVSALLPDQRLILLWLWASPYLSCCGSGFLPIKPAAATLGLDPEALSGGLRTLHDADLILQDEVTGEIFILDWYRFHTFKAGVGQKSLVAAINKVQSDAIKNEILLKSIAYLPTATATATATANSSASKHAEEVPAYVQRNEKNKKSPVGRKEKILVEGVQCWGPKNGKNEEAEEANALVAEIGVEKFKKIVKKLISSGRGEPFLSDVRKQLDLEAQVKFLASSNSKKFTTSKDFAPPANPMRIREGGLKEFLKN